MDHFLHLFVGEMQRMVKYSILAASVIVIVLWITALHFTEIQDVSMMFAILLFIDATTMSILWVGVTLYFERDEGSLRSLLVTPITHLEYLLAKISANCALNIQTMLILYLYAHFLREIHLDFLPLLAAVALVAIFHSLLGLLLTYYSDSFTHLLMNMMKYVFVFMLPVMLAEVGVFQSELVRNLLYVVPTRASMTLITASTGLLEAWEIWFSAAYLLIGCGFLLRIALRKFDEFAAGEGGQ